MAFDLFKKKEEGEEKITVNLKVKIYVNKPDTAAPVPPMMILTKKKAEKLKQDLAEAIRNSKDYVRINLIGEVNPAQEKGKDYSFIAVEEMKAPK